MYLLVCFTPFHTRFFFKTNSSYLKECDTLKATWLQAFAYKNIVLTLGSHVLLKSPYLLYLSTDFYCALTIEIKRFHTVTVQPGVGGAG
jgi:hypothetical protein